MSSQPMSFPELRPGKRTDITSRCDFCALQLGSLVPRFACRSSCKPLANHSLSQYASPRCLILSSVLRVRHVDASTSDKTSFDRDADSQRRTMDHGMRPGGGSG